MTTKLIKHWIDGWITGNLRRDFHIFQLDSHSHRHKHTQTKNNNFVFAFLSSCLICLFAKQTIEDRETKQQQQAQFRTAII